jgi:hypothetical protein
MKNIIAAPCSTACSLIVATRWALGPHKPGTNPSPAPAIRRGSCLRTFLGRQD